MTKKYLKARELYSEIKDKTKISENFLYNAICYFDLPSESVVEILNDLPVENCIELKSVLHECREKTKEILRETLTSGEFSKSFHDPEIEDIVFYQLAHGEPVN